MILPRYCSLATVGRVLTIYLLLVGYSAAYEYFYATQLTELYHDDYTTFDFLKLDIYTAICFLTPLALLPLGTRLRAPGQLIVGAASVLIFIPIPIVFVPMVTPAEFWRVYALLWLGYLAVTTLGSRTVNIPLPAVSERRFQQILLVFFLIAGLGFAYVLGTNHFQIVSLDKAHAAQADVTVAGWQGYLMVGYMTSFGSLLVAVAIMYRKYYLLPLAVLGWVGCYGALSERGAVLMPFWITYVYVAQRLFFRESVVRFLLTVMAPFLICLALVFILGLEDRKSAFYDAFTLANYRLYSVPAIGFNVYYDYFSLHAYTYWSHIGFISNFVSYPYGQPLAMVLAEQYSLGNDNASFLETDGLAAAGPLMLPFISIIFGLVMLTINSCMRGLNITMCAIIMAGACIALIDTGLGPSLLTNGLIALTVLMLFAPRNASWNLRYLTQRTRATVA